MQILRITIKNYRSLFKDAATGDDLKRLLIYLSAGLLSEETDTDTIIISDGPG